MSGADTTVIQYKIIGNNCIIGANSIVLTDIGDDMRIYGIVSKNVGYRLTSYAILSGTSFIREVA